MPETSFPASPRLQSKIHLAAALLFFFGVGVLLQKSGGAYEAEFGSEPDEAAHYVTGLCVRDYIAGGFRQTANPLDYAKRYYEHYPKVAIGHWPPMFYLIQSAWTIPFSPNRTSVMLLMAFLSAGTATLLFSVLKKEFNWFHGALGGLLFLLLPLTQRFSMAVMTEIPIAFLSLAATVSFGKFLDGEQFRHSIWFGIFASLAILTKQSALALAFVPLLGIVLTRKFYLLKRLSFWSSAIVVFLLCAPWNLLTYKFASDGWEGGGWGWKFSAQAIQFYGKKLYVALGVVFLLLAVCGLGIKLRAALKEKAGSGIFISTAALLAGVVVFHIAVPVGFEDRHLVPALPALIFFMVASICAMARWWSKRRLDSPRSERGALALMLIAAIVLSSVLGVFRIQHKGYRGFGDVAEYLLQKSEAKWEKFLVASDARGEGMFISEIAMRENRPGRVIKRASKELASSSWSGGGYKTKFADEAGVATFLGTNAIHYVVLDRSLPGNLRKEYHDLLIRTLERKGDSERFILDRSFPIERGGKFYEGAIEVYRLRKSVE